VSLTKQDAKDVERAIKTLDRIADRAGLKWYDDSAYDPVSSALLQLQGIRQALQLRE